MVLGSLLIMITKQGEVNRPAFSLDASPNMKKNLYKKDFFFFKFEPRFIQTNVKIEQQRNPSVSF